MVTAGILAFRENSHGRTGNRTRDLMISSQRLWSLDHEAGLFLYLLRLQVTCINRKLLSRNLFCSPITSSLPGSNISLGSLFSQTCHSRASTNITEKLKRISERSGEKKTLLSEPWTVRLVVCCCIQLSPGKCVFNKCHSGHQLSAPGNFKFRMPAVS